MSLADGWMCPLYKKNERDNIANYRPITLLNTDYKILTKAMSLALSEVVSEMVHKDQAGFMPGQKIQDQIRLAQLIINWAECTSNNGVIISLDQEKAYDKIKHDYIKKIFNAFNILDQFINTFFAIGTFATTRVMINGELSSPYKVTRGFHQGCPLSCIAFDLAIEPLACMIRSSNIEGFQVPGKAERIKTMLFADDTSCYLSENDSFSTLQNEVLQKWCFASGAKFNIAKSVVIPVGNPCYRARVCATRKVNDHDEPIPENVHIAADGEATRILGGWIGNDINPVAPWNRVLDEIATFLERWNHTNPTVTGRKLVTQMVIAGKSQYLHMVNGMPKEVEKRLNKLTNNFMNGYRPSPTINQETLRAPSEIGGLNVFDIHVQDEAIQLMWLKGYLAEKDRPAWAYLVDDILRQHVWKKDEALDKEFHENTFTQSWSPNSRKGGLPKEIKKMLDTAKRNGLTIERPS
jgi:hypothetical protein